MSVIVTLSDLHGGGQLPPKPPARYGPEWKGPNEPLHPLPLKICDDQNIIQLTYKWNISYTLQ